jgi:hypothetical protein
LQKPGWMVIAVDLPLAESISYRLAIVFWVCIEFVLDAWFQDYLQIFQRRCLGGSTGIIYLVP